MNFYPLHPNLSPEAKAALEDDSKISPPWCFYPRGYPHISAIRNATGPKKDRDLDKDWSWQKPRKKKIK